MGPGDFPKLGYGLGYKQGGGSLLREKCKQWRHHVLMSASSKNVQSSSFAACVRFDVAISLGDIRFHANTERFQGLVPLWPHLCPLSVRLGGVCGSYSESP